MRKLRLYIDTSVWNMHFDLHVPMLCQNTRDFFETVKSNAYEVFISGYVMAEIRKAPEIRQREIFGLISDISPISLEPSLEAENVIDEYLKGELFSTSSLIDASHVAYCSVYELDALISWNYKHLANLSRRNRIRSFNLRLGYMHNLDILTPLEVIESENH